MPSKTIVLPWPMSGVVRRTSFQESPQIATPDAMNVRTNDPILGRDRGGSRPGISKAYDEQLPGPIRMQETVRFVQDNHVKSRLVLSAGGNLYMESDLGAIVLKQTTPTLSRYNSFQAVDFSGNLYIANTGRGAISGDWISGPSQIGTGGTPWQNGVRRPNYVAGSVSTDTEITDRLALDGPPLKYDPVADTLTELVATEGTIPSGCQIISRYAGRLVLAGDPASPSQWYMSKVLDPTDWDYSTQLDDRAVSATSSSMAGVIGSPITAFVPHTDLCATIGCATSLWFLRGDPVTGVMDNVSMEIGIVDKNAWCRTADGWLVFLSHDGIYAIPGQCDARQPESISREKLPEELLGVNPNQYAISMQYDVRERGIHLCLTSNDPDTIDSQHWWIDWRTKAMWPFSLQTDHDPTSLVHRRDISTTGSQVFLGCRDGYIRVFDRDTEDDDGETFSGYVWMGPLQPGGESDGMISAICGKLASGSGDVTWSLHIGQTAEEAFANPAAASGVFTDFASRMGIKQRLRLKADTVFLKLSAVTAGQEWSLEQVSVDITKIGCPEGC